MIPSLEIDTDKTIIIGLTGPLASGCTTLSKFIADVPFKGHDGITAFLRYNNYITDTLKINYNIFSDNINTLYENKNKLKAEPTEEKSCLMKSTLANGNDFAHLGF